MGTESSPSLEILEEALCIWESTVVFIERGWDCIAEYLHDVGQREILCDLLEEYEAAAALPEAMKKRVQVADARFRAATEPSNLSVHDCGPKFRYYDHDSIAILPVAREDMQKYWFNYRWQPDCPLPWKNSDAYSYQRTVYGLDLLHMTREELFDAVRAPITRSKQTASL